jgi:hypothetical protein
MRAALEQETMQKMALVKIVKAFKAKKGVDVSCQTEEVEGDRLFSLTSDIAGDERKMLDDHSFISDISNHQDIIEAPVKKS